MMILLVLLLDVLGSLNAQTAGNPYNPLVPCPGIYTVIILITKNVPANLHECE